MSSFSLENAYEADYQMQNFVSKISKFLSSSQEYQHDQQNNFQNQIQIVLIFFNQNSDSDWYVSKYSVSDKMIHEAMNSAAISAERAAAVWENEDR